MTLGPTVAVAQQADPPAMRGMNMQDMHGPQGMMGQMCGMQGGGMWIGMVLCGLLIFSAIAAFVALTIFLIRRSRPNMPSATPGE